MSNRAVEQEENRSFDVPSHIQKYALKLQWDIQKLIAEDFRPDGLASAILSVDGESVCQEMCDQVAVLSRLYGPEGYHKLLLEAYLWTSGIRGILNELGWLEGGIVVIDSRRETVTLPHADFVSSALRMPKIRPYDHASDGINTLMSTTSFKKAWNETCQGAGLFPDLKDPLRSEVLESLGSFVFARNTGPSDLVRRHIVQPMLAEVYRIEQALPPGISSRNCDFERIVEILTLHLTSIVEDKHLRDLRLFQAEDKFHQRTEFLKFFGPDAEVSVLERDLRVLFVPDGEVSFLLLEFALSSQEIAGLLEMDAEHLGLLRGERARRMSGWLRDILEIREIENFNDSEWRNYFVLLKGKAWKWLKSVHQQSPSDLMQVIDRMHQASTTGGPLLPALRELCTKLWPSGSGRPTGQIQRLSPIALPIHRYLRQDESTDRALLAFPLTGWNLKSEIFRNVAAYFVGTIRPRAQNELREQISLLRSVISLSLWPTVARSMENEDESSQRTTNIFGHDLKNRLDETAFETTLNELVRFSQDDSVAASGKKLLDHLKMLYGTVELYRCISKITSNRLPAAWAELAASWPPDPFPREYLKEAAEACDLHIRHIASCYASSLQQNITVYLRRLNAQRNVEESISLAEIAQVRPKLCFPPFSVKLTPAGPLAILAGLTELTRNALKTVMEKTQLADMHKRYGILHVDFQITISEPDVIEVNIWNPTWRGRLRQSATVENCKWMYQKLNAVSLIPARIVQYQMGDGTDAPYALSSFRLHLSRLRFDKQ